MYRVCIIGTGLISRSHAGALKAIENAELVAACDIVPEAAELFASTFDCKAYTDIEKMLDEEKPDFAIICTPTFLHYPQTKICVERNINVLCEKPLEREPDRAFLLKEAVDKSGVIFMTGQVVRFWSGYVKIKEWYDAGELGEIKMAHLRRVSSLAGDYSPWLYTPDQGGGAMHDVLVHDVDFLRYLCGPFKQVYANAVKDHTGCYNHVIANIIHANGVHAIAEASMMMQTGYPFSFAITLTCTEATIEYKYHAGATITDRTGEFCEFKIWRKGIGVEEFTVDIYDAYETQLREFIACVEAGKQSDIMPISDSVEVIQAVDAIHQSADDGKIHYL